MCADTHVTTHSNASNTSTCGRSRDRHHTKHVLANASPNKLVICKSGIFKDGNNTGQLYNGCRLKSRYQCSLAKKTYLTPTYYHAPLAIAIGNIIYKITFRNYYACTWLLLAHKYSNTHLHTMITTYTCQDVKERGYVRSANYHVLAMNGP
jgi:hypothetical protein